MVYMKQFDLWRERLFGTKCVQKNIVAGGNVIGCGTNVVQQNIKTTGSVVGGTSSKSKSVISVNGKSYVGKNLEIKNGVVFIDGVEATPDSSVRSIQIVVNGNVDLIDADVCDIISVSGVCKDVKSQHGNITVSGNIGGNASTHIGNISAGSVGGSVKTHIGNITK